MVKFRLEFDTEKIFKPKYRPAIDRYLRGKETVQEACMSILGWNRQIWERHMSGIFSVALAPENDSAKIEEEDPDVVMVPLGISDIDEIASFLKKCFGSDYLKGLAEEMLKQI